MNKSFDWEMFWKNATAETKAKLSSIKNSASKLSRDSAPLRGCFNKFKSIDRCEAWLKALFDDLLRFIKTSFEGRSLDAILTMEQFQMTQKGPTGPIKKSQFMTDVVEKFSHLPQFSIPMDKIGTLRKLWENIKSDLLKYVSFDASIIRYDLMWKELPNQTVRGFPYHRIGADVDEKIIGEGGSTLSQALSYFLSSQQLISFPGYRIQGKPLSKGAKIRLINIPAVSYQYINVGLYKTSMDKLKNHPAFSGWLDPVARSISIQKQINQCKSLDYSFISLDFSSFDQTCGSELRKMVNELIVEADVSRSLSEYKKHYDKLCDEQFLVVPQASGFDIKNASGMLFSGVINTQHDGSLINMLVQAYVAYRLGFQFNPNLSLVLGDDVGFAVPNKYLKSIGYKNLLIKINEYANEIGFTVHTGKAYPNSDLIFLQKLYVPDQDIHALGSWARALSSFVYKERFTKKVKGVYSLPALELISQISILNEAYGSENGTNHGKFGDRVAEVWLQVDDFLVSCCQQVEKVNPSFNGDDLFKFIIKLVSNDINLIKQHLGVQSYDHKGSISSIQSTRSYEEVFPILSSIVSKYRQSLWQEKDFQSLVKNDDLSSFDVSVETDEV